MENLGYFPWITSLWVVSVALFVSENGDLRLRQLKFDYIFTIVVQHCTFPDFVFVASTPFTTANKAVC